MKETEKEFYIKIHSFIIELTISSHTNSNSKLHNHLKDLGFSFILKSRQYDRIKLFADLRNKVLLAC